MPKHYKIKDGLLENILFIPSPNCNEYPENTEISLLVIHCISLPPHEFGGNGIIELFTNVLNPKEHPYYETIASLKVSAHLLIRRDGEIIQFVPFNKRAWHAGASQFDGKENCNDFSIGIELEGTDISPFTEIQYQKLGLITKTLLRAYPKITPDHITGHSDIAPGRKTDPGSEFDWQKYRNLIH
jgi:AmpD protein